MRQWIVAVISGLAMSGSLHAVEYTWTGGGGDGRWGTKANWRPASGVPGTGDDVIFPETEKPVEITLEADQAARSITFSPGNPVAYTISGFSITLDDDGFISYLKLVKDPGIKLNARQTINSDLKLAGRATFTNMNRFYVRNETLVIAGRLSGKQPITVTGNGAGETFFEGDNSDFSGPIVITKGGRGYFNNRSSLGTSKEAVRLIDGSWLMRQGDTAHEMNIAGQSVYQIGPGHHGGQIVVGRDAVCTLMISQDGHLEGPLVGEGRVTCSARGGTIAGTVPNTLAGSFTLERGLTILAKPAGVDAIACPVVMKAAATLRWGADEQIADSSPITLQPRLNVLDLNGHRETVGALDLQGSSFVDCGDGSDVLQVADSHDVSWDCSKELVIRNWGGSKTGGGTDRINFGDNAESLTSEQLACLGFRDPAGFPDGLYTAALLKTGELVPSKPVQPVNPPYDLSEKARAERQRLYEVGGLEALSGKGTPLKKGMKISFYGDSITWNRSYIGTIETALESGEGTKDLGVTLLNHGVNGGGVLQLRDGDEGTAHFGNTKPRPFAETLAEDKPDVVVVFIGINDTGWRKTSPEDFEKALTDLVTSAKANKVPMVLTTLGVWGDDPSKDATKNVKCDEYSEIVRTVAAANDVTLADLRKACLAYLMNHNGELRLNGSLRFAPTGIISGDGVHLGGKVPAEIISLGVFDALKKKS